MTHGGGMVSTAGKAARGTLPDAGSIPAASTTTGRAQPRRKKRNEDST